MIYNLFLSSNVYFSANTSTDMGQRVYAIDWSFLPEDKQYKVKMRFNSLKYGFSGNDVYSVNASFGPNATTFQGSNKVERKNNNSLGIIRPQMSTVASTEMQLIALPDDNPPIYLQYRPNNNLLEIIIRTIQGNQYGLNAEYFLILSFEEVDKK